MFVVEKKLVTVSPWRNHACSLGVGATETVPQHAQARWQEISLYIQNIVYGVCDHHNIKMARPHARAACDLPSDFSVVTLHRHGAWGACTLGV